MSTTSDELNEFNDNQQSILQEENKEKKKVTISSLLIVVGIESFKQYNKANTCTMIKVQRNKNASCHCTLY